MVKKKKPPETESDIRNAILLAIRGTVTGAPDVETLAVFTGVSSARIIKGLKVLLARKEVSRHTTKQRLASGKWVPWTRYRLTF